MMDLSSAQLLVCEKLWKIFPAPEGVVHALRDVSLEVNVGEFLCVTGPSGSGKSTLLNLIGGLERPSKGEIAVLGQRYSDLNDHALGSFRRQNIGYVFQELGLISHLTAEENVAFPYLFDGTPKEKVRERARLVLEEVQMSHRLDHFPGHLSAGERQRVAIARVMLGRPKILLADEPTANLDWPRANSIIILLRHLCNKGTGLILATHDDRIKVQADRVLSIVDGIVQAPSFPLDAI